MIERPNQTARLFLAVLTPLSFLVGLGLNQFPQLTQGGFPAYSWALMLAFLIEAALRRRIDRAELPPLTMLWRFIGVIAAALLCQVGSAGLEKGLDLSSLISGS